MNKCAKVLSLTLGLWMGIFTMKVGAYTLLLPETQPTPPLPYCIEADHYSGPASAQMVMNATPNPGWRVYMSQDDIYAHILAHNTEPALWFTDPNGMEWVLENLLPGGNWGTFSFSNPQDTMGKVLYYMASYNYLTPLLITSGEHWVVVRGFTTNINPLHSGTVTLNEIIIYDPHSCSSHIISGSTWYGSNSYWGQPINKPTSVWHGKYVAVIEPPEVSCSVVAPEEVLIGKIIPKWRAIEAAEKWIREHRKIYPMLPEDPKPLPPILIEKERGSYYLIPFEAQSSQIVVLINAYDANFQELGIFPEAVKYLSKEEAIDIAEDFLVSKGKELVKTCPEFIPAPELVSDAATGRYFPLWKVSVAVMVEKEETKKKGCLFFPGKPEYELPQVQLIEVYINQKGEVQRYLAKKKYFVYEREERE